MVKHRRCSQLGCRFIHYLVEQRPADDVRSHAPDPEIAIDRRQLRTILHSLESLSGE